MLLKHILKKIVWKGHRGSRIPDSALSGKGRRPIYFSCYAAAVVFCWALLEIGLADKKYGIIPDQFVILTAISALGFIPFHSSFLQPMWGMLLGGGVMLASALIGKLILKKETLG